MATESIRIPVKTVNRKPWGQLWLFGDRHEFCGYDIRLREENFSFAGGHRVRLYVARGNVHWRIPEGVPLDITQVQPENPPRRLLRR